MSEQFRSLPKVYGPALTLLFVVFYHGLAHRLGWPVNAIWIAVAVVYGTFLSGLRGGLASAAIGAAYAFYTLPLDHGLQVVVGMPIIAFVVGWQTRELRAALAKAIKNQRAADIVDSVNGNIRLNIQAIRILDQVRDGWDIRPKGVSLQMIEEARGKLADLATLTKSYHAIAQERETLLRGEDER